MRDIISLCNRDGSIRSFAQLPSHSENYNRLGLLLLKALDPGDIWAGAVKCVESLRERTTDPEGWPLPKFPSELSRTDYSGPYSGRDHLILRVFELDEDGAFRYYLPFDVIEDGPVFTCSLAQPDGLELARTVLEYDEQTADRLSLRLETYSYEETRPWDYFRDCMKAGYRKAAETIRRDADGWIPPRFILDTEPTVSSREAGQFELRMHDSDGVCVGACIFVYHTNTAGEPMQVMLQLPHILANLCMPGGGKLIVASDIADGGDVVRCGQRVREVLVDYLHIYEDSFPAVMQTINLYHATRRYGSEWASDHAVQIGTDFSRLDRRPEGPEERIIEPVYPFHIPAEVFGAVRVMELVWMVATHMALDLDPQFFVPAILPDLYKRTRELFCTTFLDFMPDPLWNVGSGHIYDVSEMGKDMPRSVSWISSWDSQEARNPISSFDVLLKAQDGSWSYYTGSMLEDAFQDILLETAAGKLSHKAFLSLYTESLKRWQDVLYVRHDIPCEVREPVWFMRPLSNDIRPTRICCRSYDPDGAKDGFGGLLVRDGQVAVEIVDDETGEVLGTEADLDGLYGFAIAMAPALAEVGRELLSPLSTLQVVACETESGEASHRTVRRCVTVPKGWTGLRVIYQCGDTDFLAVPSDPESISAGMDSLNELDEALCPACAGGR